MKLAQHDAVCEFCNNATRGCKYLCAPLQWVDGDFPRHEKLLRDCSQINEMVSENPNEKIAELIENNRQRWETVMAEKNCRLFMLSIALLRGFKKEKIAEAMSLSLSQINRIISGK